MNASSALLRMLLAVCLFSASLTAQATLILDGGGNALQITDLEIDGTQYDVTFGVGSFNDIFGSSAIPDVIPAFTGASIQLQLEALRSITDVLNSKSVALVSDGLLTANSIIIADDFSSSHFTGAWSGLDVPLPWGSQSGIFGLRRHESLLDFNFSFAQFTEASLVPAPATGPLILVALMALVRRKRRAKLLVVENS